MVATPEFEILSKYFYIFVPDRPLGLSIFVSPAVPPFPESISPLNLSKPHPVSRFPPHLSRNPLRIVPGVPFSAPPVPKSLPNLSRCPVFRPTCLEMPAESVPVSRFPPHLAKGGGGIGGKMEQREVNMRRAVKMRKAGGELIQMLDNKKKLRGRCNNAGKFSFIR